MSHPALHRLRILAPILAALTLLLVLLPATFFYYKFVAAGLSQFVKNGLDNPTARQFAAALMLREVIPIYGLTSLIAWLATWLWGRSPWALGRDWAHGWKGRQAFGLSLAALVWIHLCLWWRVPTALWVFPGLARIPFFLLFPLLVLATLGPVAMWLWVRKVGLGRSVTALGGWVILWSLLAQVPFWAQRPAPSVADSTAPVKILVVGLDGLRPDVAYQRGLQDFQGLHFPNAYTPLPATRLCYSVLWGGDPAHYSVGHALPSFDEVDGRVNYELLDAMRAKGMKVRFYIDDGGTIGLSGRTAEFDEVLMPARGWENFVNSNLAVHLPLYATWLDALRVFPTTTPWSPVDASLRAALAHGRGADVVMFHSCLVHQPMFLDRAELGQIPRWWTLSPADLRPYMAWWQAPLDRDDQFDLRRDPLGAYAIRIGTILGAWKGIWKDLESDPAYRSATRIFLSDHGERFYHATEKIRLQGTHGFDLDPWTLRVPLVITGPGVPQGQGTTTAVSLMEIRDALWSWTSKNEPITGSSFGHLPFAPVRYHTLDTEFLRPSEIKYRQTDTKEIIEGSVMLKDGGWILRYGKTAEERGQDVSLAEAVKDRLTIWKPLKDGGGHKLVFDGLTLMEESTVDEATFQKAKRRIEKLFLRDWKQTPR